MNGIEERFVQNYSAIARDGLNILVSPEYDSVPTHLRERAYDAKMSQLEAFDRDFPELGSHFAHIREHYAQLAHRILDQWFHEQSVSSAA